MEVFKVGGAVRDRLMGKPSKDNDFVVVGTTPAKMLEKGFQKVGADFPVFLHPKTGEEYALARTERKSGTGYNGFEVDFSEEVTLEADLLRRDLTINAMAEDADGNVIDPFNGQKDLEKGILRHVSEAFAEDPVRVLRVARFAARFGFKVAKETNALMKSLVRSGELEELTPERVWLEMEKALGTESPSTFFEVLDDCGALKVLFPELRNQKGQIQPVQWHPEGDSWVHTMLVLDQATKMTEDTTVRFAALCHDFGKGTTPKAMLPKHIGHESRGKHLVREFCDKWKIPNDHKDIAVRMAECHTYVHQIDKMRPVKIVEKLQLMGALKEPREEARVQFEKLLMACEADARGRGPASEVETYPQRQKCLKYQEAALGVSTAKIAETGVTGKKFGEVLKQHRVKAVAQIKNPKK